MWSLKRLFPARPSLLMGGLESRLHGGDAGAPFRPPGDQRAERNDHERRRKAGGCFAAEAGGDEGWSDHFSPVGGRRGPRAAPSAQAHLSLVLLWRAKRPTPAKPKSIITHVGVSGTAAVERVTPAMIVLTSARTQARRSLARPRCAKNPTPAKPMISIAHVESSGTLATPFSMKYRLPFPFTTTMVGLLASTALK